MELLAELQLRQTVQSPASPQGPRARLSPERVTAPHLSNEAHAIAEYIRSPRVHHISAKGPPGPARTASDDATLRSMPNDSPKTKPKAKPNENSLLLDDSRVVVILDEEKGWMMKDVKKKTTGQPSRGNFCMCGAAPAPIEISRRPRSAGAPKIVSAAAVGASSKQCHIFPETDNLEAMTGLDIAKHMSNGFQQCKSWFQEGAAWAS